MNRLLVFAVLLAALLAVDARAGVQDQGKTGGADEETARAEKGGQPTGSKFAPAERRTMMKLHNEERTSVGVSPLTWSPDLAAYAQKWADHLASTNATVGAVAPT